MRKTKLQYGVRRYPNRDVWYVFDYWNGCVVSTPWYNQVGADGRAKAFNEWRETGKCPQTSL